ncbi:hypothetical protein [Streptomyces sp. BE133]|uniref:hypothetical protein n=1 Tax=Streptomyces sp. BE133 TaxID=3002523 RepID=UPI002E77C150|nr:hypothetical protein [Streptomyces sp. BE133]MEE1807648.1 hypothetical protein [Streptomyces sp. BE133]
MLIAVMDPTSRGEGGAARLRHAGVEVETHVLKKEALAVLGSWHSSLRSGRPTLHLLLQMDAAGRPIAPSPVALAEIAVQRHVHDLVIFGAGPAEEGRISSHGSVFSVPTCPLPPAPP